MVFILICNYCYTNGRSDSDILCYSTYEKAKREFDYRVRADVVSGGEEAFNQDDYAVVNMKKAFSLNNTSYEIVEKELY